MRYIVSLVVLVALMAGAVLAWPQISSRSGLLKPAVPASHIGTSTRMLFPLPQSLQSAVVLPDVNTQCDARAEKAALQPVIAHFFASSTVWVEVASGTPQPLQNRMAGSACITTTGSRRASTV